MAWCNDICDYNDFLYCQDDCLADPGAEYEYCGDNICQSQYNENVDCVADCPEQTATTTENLMNKYNQTISTTTNFDELGNQIGYSVKVTEYQYFDTIFYGVIILIPFILIYLFRQKK